MPRDARRKTGIGAGLRSTLGIAVALGLIGSPAVADVIEHGLPPPILLPVMRQPVSAPSPLQAELSPEVQQSLGCAIAGAGGTAAALAAGGENLVNIIAGGVVAPQNRAVLYIGLAGVVFASFCAIGQALTPLYLYAVTTPEPPPAQAARALTRASPGSLAPLLVRTGTSAHGPLANRFLAQAGATALR